MSVIFGIALWEKAIKRDYGMLPKKFVNEFVGLACSFCQAHCYIELALLDGAVLRQAPLTISKTVPLTLL